MSGHVHYLSELDDEDYAVLPDAVDGTHRILITEDALRSIGDYTRSQPTGPSPGRVYRKNLGWAPEHPDSWWVYVCEADPADPTYTLHHPHRAEVVQ